MVLASRVLSLLSAALWVLSLTTPVLDSRDQDGISMVQTALGGTESGLKADWPLFAALGAAVILCALSAWIGRSRRWALAALIVAAVNERNYPIVLGAVLITTAIIVLATLISDLVIAWLDPRQREGL